MVPEKWLCAEGCFVPKEENSTSIDQFREISLLSVEGKLFWTVIAKRMNEYMVNNKYIDTTMQKGGVSGFAGCLEHTTAISQLIGEAKRAKKNLSVVWLDLEKAYPSVPHDLITFALRHYHIPEKVIDMVRQHLSGMKMRFSSGSFTTNWQSLERGIMAGCSIFQSRCS